MAFQAGKPALGQSTRRAVAWTSAGQVISFTIQMITQVALAHLLTPLEIGVFTVALATTSLVSATQSAGLNQLVIRAHSDRDLLETTFTVNAILSLMLAASIWAAGYLAALIYHDGTVRAVMAVLAIPPILGIFQFLPAALLQRDMRFDLIAFVNTVRVGVTAAVTLVLAFLHFGPMSLGLGGVAGASITAILFCSVGRRHMMHRMRLSQWRPVASFGLQMIAIAGVTVASSRLADLVLGRLLGLDALGIYSRASGINAILWENIHAVLGRIFLSDLAERHRNGHSLRLSYIKIIGMLSAMLWPAFAGLAVLARPLVKTVYGSQWTDAADPLSFLALSSIILISVSMVWEIFVVCGRTGQQARIEIKRNLIGLGAFCLGCLFSNLGAALARVFDALVSVCLYRRPLSQMTDTDLGDILPVLRHSALLTCVAVAPSLGLMSWFRFSFDVPIGTVLASVVVGMLAWLTALLLTDHPLFNEFNLLRLKFAAVLGM